MALLLERVPGKFIFHDELPECVACVKGTSRCYDNGPTSYGRLLQFLAEWDGRQIRVSDLREQLGISKAVWKDLMADPRVVTLLKKVNLQRAGRGVNATWYIPNEKCA